MNPWIIGLIVYVVFVLVYLYCLMTVGKWADEDAEEVFRRHVASKGDGEVICPP